MTTLKEKLKGDLITSMKAGNAFEKTVLRSVLSVIQNKEKRPEGEIELSDTQVEAIINSAVKIRRASAATYTKDGAPPERAELETREADFLADNYLPKRLTEEEVEVIVKKTIAALDNPNFGQVMKIAVPATDNRSDGKTISAIVKRNLS